MIAGISIFVLVVAILIAWKFKWNPGIVGFFVAFIFGFFVYSQGVPISSIEGQAKVLFSGFNAKLWLRIMMVSIFFAIAQVDGTLEILTKKVINSIRGKNKLLPIIFYFLTLVLSAIGAGSIGVLILLMPLAAAMIKAQKLDFMLTGLCIAIGAAVGGVSPMAPTGIIGVSVAAQQGIEVGNSLFLHYLLCGTITVFILYVCLGGWKYPNAEVITGEVVRFNSIQLKTLAGIVLFAVLAIMGYEIAFVAGGCIGFLCLIERNIDQKKIISMVPWSTLVLLAGMGVLVTVVSTAGGVDWLTSFFSQFMTAKTAGVMVTVIAGFMSFVSSASGVVMPTLIPIVPSLAEVTGVDPVSLINAITFGAHQTGISPFSTGGSLILSMGGENIDQQKTFNKLIITSFVILTLGCIYSYLGLLG